MKDSLTERNEPSKTARLSLLRQEASRLIGQVLDERISPRFALNRWPGDPDAEADASLASAYQALWHFEADEEQQQKELYYLDAQMELLKQMARHLASGNVLPDYLCRSYPKDHTVLYYEEKRVLKEAVELTHRVALSLWSNLAETWQTARRVLKPEKSQPPQKPYSSQPSYFTRHRP